MIDSNSLALAALFSASDLVSYEAKDSDMSSTDQSHLSGHFQLQLTSEQLCVDEFDLDFLVTVEELYFEQLLFCNERKRS